MKPYAAAAALGLVATALTGCSLFATTPFERALELTPESATDITFVDRAAWAEQAGVGEVTSDASEDEVADYLEALSDDRDAAGTRLAGYLEVMRGKAAFSELDIEWEVASVSADRPLVRVWSMSEDLDLDDVGDDLADVGYEESEVDGHPSYTIDVGEADPTTGLVGDRYPVLELQRVTLVPDDHLVVVGEEPEEVLDLVDGDGDSALDRSEVSDAVDGRTDAWWARLVSEGACPVVDLRPSPDRPGQPVGDLGRPDLVGLFQLPDDAEDPVVDALVFPDEDAATADRAAREIWLDEGTTLQTLEPYDELVSDWRVDQEDQVVTVGVTPGDTRAVDALRELAVCSADT